MLRGILHLHICRLWRWQPVSQRHSSNEQQQQPPSILQGHNQDPTLADRMLLALTECMCAYLGTALPSGRSSAAAATLAASQEGAARKGLPPEADATSAPGAVPMRWLSCTSDFSACVGNMHTTGCCDAAKCKCFGMAEMLMSGASTPCSAT